MQRRRDRDEARTGSPIQERKAPLPTVQDLDTEASTLEQNDIITEAESDAEELTDSEILADYDTDLEPENDDGVMAFWKKNEAEQLCIHYEKFCARMKVIPSGYILRHVMDTHLNLAHIGLGTDGLRALLATLEQARGDENIRSYDLTDNNLPNDAIISLAAHMRVVGGLENLFLANNSIKTECLVPLLDAMIRLGKVKKLDISGNPLGDTGALVVAGKLLESHGIYPLRDLKMSRVGMGDKVAEMFAKALAVSEITHLDISWNSLTYPKVVSILTQLRTDLYLTYLDISFNGLGDKSCPALGLCMRDLETLIYLNVASNRITGEGIRGIADGLKDNTHLQHFIIRNNAIGTDGALRLLETMKETSTVLQTLDMTGINVDMKFMKMKAEMLSNYDRKPIKVFHGVPVGDYSLKNPFPNHNEFIRREMERNKFEEEQELAEKERALEEARRLKLEKNSQKNSKISKVQKNKDISDGEIKDKLGLESRKEIEVHTVVAGRIGSSGKETRMSDEDIFKHFKKEVDARKIDLRRAFLPHDFLQTGYIEYYHVPHVLQEWGLDLDEYTVRAIITAFSPYTLSNMTRKFYYYDLLKALYKDDLLYSCCERGQVTDQNNTSHITSPFLVFEESEVSVGKSSKSPDPNTDDAINRRDKLSVNGNNPEE